MTSNDDVLCGKNDVSMSGASVTVTSALDHDRDRPFRLAPSTPCAPPGVTGR